MEIVSLSNLYDNRLDDFVNSLDKKNIMWQLIRNTIIF